MPMLDHERPQPKRADARRNVDAILEAATRCLADDPDVSVGEIARAAGVGRVTLYGHFASRASLVSAVAQRAVRSTDEALEALDLGGDPGEALVRLVEATWELTHRFGALVVAAEKALPDEDLRSAHAGLEARVRRLVQRGRREGVFRSDLPLHWLVSTLQVVIHGAAGAVHRGEVTARQAPRLISATVLAAWNPPGTPTPEPRR